LKTLLVILALFCAGPVQAADIVGIGRVVDGDTLYVGKIKIRLNGIDAPERNTKYGPLATKTLAAVLSGGRVRCVPNGDVSYDRIIARCWIGSTDVAAAVIAAGAALDCNRYSGGRYRQFETRQARNRIKRAGY
jgi:micrococcal nuclease